MATMEENNMELLECARYGEDEDLKILLEEHGCDVNFTDGSGNTALHRAAANGEAGCIRILKSFGALHTANDSGNTPLHWAAQNGKEEGVKTLIELYESIDILAKNIHGRSCLTEAFQSKCTEVIELCLSHSSATEELLVPNANKAPSSQGGDESFSVGDVSDGEKAAVSTKDSSVSNTAEEADNTNEIIHTCCFGSNNDNAVIMKIRELPIAHADNPFGTTAAPEEDTTGLAIWPAALIMARWMVELLGRGTIDFADGLAIPSAAYFPEKAVVVELGAGCGVPALAVGAHSSPTQVHSIHITDINPPAMDNCRVNVLSNGYTLGENGAYFKESNCNEDISEQKNHQTVSVQSLSWEPHSDKLVNSPLGALADVVLGSDLVYCNDILNILAPTIVRLLQIGGSFLYVVPDDGRAGMQDFVTILGYHGLVLQSRTPAPDRYYANPLVNDGTSGEQDVDDLCVLHFYDLTAKKAHDLYHFIFDPSSITAASTSTTVPETVFDGMKP